MALPIGVGFFVTSYGRGSRIDAVHARLASLVRLQDEPRLEIARAAIAIARAHPIAGVGLDGFGLAFGPHRTAAYWTLEPEQTPLRAHQPLLQVAATQGIVGLVGWGALVLVVMHAARRALRATHGSVTHGLTLSLVVALASFALVTASGFVVAATGVLATIVAGALAGLVSGETEGTATASEPSFEAGASSLVARLAIAAAALAAFALFIALPLASDALAARGDAWMRAGRSGRATRLHVHAAQLTPWRERGFTRLAAGSTPVRLRTIPCLRVAALDEARAVTDGASVRPSRAGHMQIAPACSAALRSPTATAARRRRRSRSGIAASPSKERITRISKKRLPPHARSATRRTRNTSTHSVAPAGLTSIKQGDASGKRRLGLGDGPSSVPVDPARFVGGGGSC